jgi:hypothetical protein
MVHFLLPTCWEFTTTFFKNIFKKSGLSGFLMYNNSIAAKRYNLRIPAVSGNWKLNG